MDDDKKTEDMPSPETGNEEVADTVSSDDVAAAFGHSADSSSENELEATDTASEDTPDPASAAEPTPPPKAPKKRFSKKIIVIIVLAIAVIAAAAWLFIGGSKNSQQNAGDSTDQANKIDTTQVEAKPAAGTVVWLDTPKQLSYQAVFDEQEFKNNYSDPSADIKTAYKFYQVGTSGSDIIFLADATDGPGSQVALIKKSGESFTLLQQHSPDVFGMAGTEYSGKYIGPKLAAAAKIDATSQYSDITPPASVTIKNQVFKLPKYGALGRGYITTSQPVSSDNLLYSFASDDKAGKLYETVLREDPNYRVSYFTLVTKDHVLHEYSIDSELFLAGTPTITWTEGNKKNTVAYRSAVGGCGFNDANEIAKNIDESMLEVIGTGPKGQKVYIIKDVNHPLFVKHYNEYKEVAAYNEQLAADEKNMNLAEFKKRAGFYLAQDAQGRWIVMSNEKYIPGGGCAKPVVYLYPALTTLVNVSVGADVTLSDPYYPVGGWKGVLAQPNGKLTYKGASYDSLFWEGYGKGAYPNIVSGYFVKRSGAEAAIRSDLAKQGLNTQEINDFWEFWQSKLPNKEYVRITWISKQQLERLAPLYVSPAPDTMIRVFLDMEGADAPYPLAKQIFMTPNRNGFTVVEWGGLARDGSVPKLR